MKSYLIVMVVGAGVGLVHSPAPAQVWPKVQVPAADSLGLSLDEAIARATGQSDEVRLAQAQVDLADAQVGSARSQALPQISGNVGYTKTLASAFDTGGQPSVELPDSLRFDPDPTAPLEERVRYLEDRVPTAGLAGIGGLFSDLPFGQENTYLAQISGSQRLYSGGRTRASIRIARSFRDAAELNLVEDVAEIELQVKSAYYQALLAGELEEIAVAGLVQAEDFLATERLRLDAGQGSDLEVLRAEVSRDNLRPQLVQARNAAELATLNLKRLVDLPLTAPVRLTTTLDAPDAAELADVRLEPEVLTAQRAAIRAAEEQVAIREQQVRIAKGAFLPSVSISMNYGKQAFPTNLLDLDSEWRTDWTAGLQVQIPLFNGGSRNAELRQARVEREQSRLQLSQLRESVQLQYQQALGEKERAREAIVARQTTVSQAQRVYDLTVLRYEEGIATQLEVSQSRLELLQARTNLAQAITDYYVADAGLTRSTADAGPAPRSSRPEIPNTDPVLR